jgi:hypothetical protein
MLNRRRPKDGRVPEAQDAGRIRLGDRGDRAPRQRRPFIQQVRMPHPQRGPERGGVGHGRATDFRPELIRHHLQDFAVGCRTARCVNGVDGHRHPLCVCGHGHLLRFDHCPDVCGGIIRRQSIAVDARLRDRRVISGSNHGIGMRPRASVIRPKMVSLVPSEVRRRRRS